MTNLQIYQHVIDNRAELSKGPFHKCTCCGEKIPFGAFSESAGLKFCNEGCVWKYEEEGVNYLTN